MNSRKILSVVLAMMIFGTACSSTTLIQSSDPAARIYVDDELKGTGSATHSDTKIIGSTTMVKLKKEGCETQTFSFSRNEE